MQIKMQAPRYFNLEPPNGFLVWPEAHALFHYAQTMLENIKDEQDIKYEGTIELRNYHQLFLSIAQLYQVDPNKMARHWKAVDLQSRMLGYTLVPDQKKYRDPKAGLS